MIPIEKSHTKYIVFFTVWLTAACTTILCAILHGGMDPALGWDLFGDFFNHIQYIRNEGASRVYYQSYNATFPPFIYMMYSFFESMLPKDSSLWERSVPLLLYVWYCTFCGILFAFLGKAYIKKKIVAGKYTPPRYISRLLIFSLVFSEIYFWGILQRGNSAILACIFLLAALILREEKSKKSQELALICIATAAAIKIYPAVFGLLYLREKRFKEAFRLTVYGMLLFFLPFVFFGGIPSCIQLFKNLATAAYYCPREIENLIGIQTFCRFLWHRLIGAETPPAAEMLFIFLSAAYFILAVIATCILKEEWKQLFMLVSIMVLVPSWSGGYTRIYFTIPLISFMFYPKANRDTIPFALLFACIFSLSHIQDDIPVLGKLDTILLFLPIYILSIALSAEMLTLVFRGLNAPKRKDV